MTTKDDEDAIGGTDEIVLDHAPDLTRPGAMKAITGTVDTIAEIQ